MNEPRPKIVPLSTSVREDELDDITQLSADLEKVVPTNPRFIRDGIPSRSGMLRAMLRYTLEHPAEFIEWMKRTDGQPE